MNLHSACRALLYGATLLAVTATAGPSPAPAQAAASPCLTAQPASATGQPPAAHKRRQWRGPCYLADAEKKGDEHADDADAARQDIQQRLDEIDLLARHGMPASEATDLLWIASGERSDGDGWLPPADGAPVGGARGRHPMYAVSVTHTMLQADGARAGGDIPAVPEPAHVILLLTGLAVLAGVGVARRQRHT
jgi:hypothetical protein